MHLRAVFLFLATLVVVNAFNGLPSSGLGVRRSALGICGRLPLRMPETRRGGSTLRMSDEKKDGAIYEEEEPPKPKGGKQVHDLM